MDAASACFFSPFFGGQNDRLTLGVVVRIRANPRMRGTVVRITKCDIGEEDNLVLPAEGKNMEEINALTVGSVRPFYFIFLVRCLLFPCCTENRWYTRYGLRTA